MRHPSFISVPSFLLASPRNAFRFILLGSVTDDGPQRSGSTAFAKIRLYPYNTEHIGTYRATAGYCIWASALSSAEHIGLISQPSALDNYNKSVTQPVSGLESFYRLLPEILRTCPIPSHRHPLSTPYGVRRLDKETRTIHPHLAIPRNHVLRSTPHHPSASGSAPGQVAPGPLTATEPVLGVHQTDLRPHRSVVPSLAAPTRLDAPTRLSKVQTLFCSNLQSSLPVSRNWLRE